MLTDGRKIVPSFRMKTCICLVISSILQIVGHIYLSFVIFRCVLDESHQNAHIRSDKWDSLYFTLTKDTQVTNSMFPSLIFVAIFYTHAPPSIFHRHFCANFFAFLQFKFQLKEIFFCSTHQYFLAPSLLYESIDDYSNNMDKSRKKKKKKQRYANRLFIRVLFIFESASLFVLHFMFFFYKNNTNNDSSENM